MTDGFVSRVNTSVVPRVARNRDALRGPAGDAINALGEGLGRAASAARQADEAEAEAQYQIDQIEQRRARSALIADRAGAWADVQSDADIAIAELRQSSAPGAAGHRQKSREAVARMLDDFTATLGNDPEVVQNFYPMMARYAARSDQNEALWEMQKSSEHQGASFAKFSDAKGNAVLADSDPQLFQDAIAEGDLLLDGMDMDGTTREIERAKYRAVLTGRYFDGLFIKGNVDGAKGLLEKGTLDAFMEPAVKSVLLKRVALEEERLAREAEIAANEQRRAAKERIDAIMAMARDGAASEAMLLEAQKLAQSLGLDETVYEVGKARVINQTSLKFGDANLAQLDGAIGALRAKVAKAGDRRKPGDVIALERLIEMRDEKMAVLTGPMSDLAKSGPDGTMEVLGQLAGMDREDRYAMAERVQPGLGRVSQLGPVPMAYAVEGKQIRKDRGDKLTPDAKVKAGMEKAVGRVSPFLGSEYGGIRDVAADMYAGWAASKGIKEFRADDYMTLVSIALGAKRRKNGKMQGGIGNYGGQKVYLPSRLTSAEFKESITLADFSGARWGNGDPVEKSYVLASMIPEAVAEHEDGSVSYRFVNLAGHYLVNASKGEYRLRVKNEVK